MDSMVKHFLNPPNWFTSASLFCGLYSIILATGVEGEANFSRAAAMIIFAGVFDMLDGGVARITRTGTDFGVQLDSIVDVVSFGIAPAILLYAWGIHSLGTVGLVGAFMFCLCGAFRLSRFNCSTSGEKTLFSEGLTITCGGGTIAAWVWAHASTGRTSVEHPWYVLLVATVLGFLMISRVPYRSIQTLRLARGSLIGLALFLGGLTVVAVRFNFSTAFMTLCTLYVALGPVESILFGRHRFYAAEVPIEGIDDDLSDPG